MNWIEYAKQKPSPEPKRQVLMKTTGGYYETYWSHNNLTEAHVTHWAEIEPPSEIDPPKISPDPFEELRRMANIHKPQPPAICEWVIRFEEWWNQKEQAYIQSTTSETRARTIWDAAWKRAKEEL